MKRTCCICLTTVWLLAVPPASYTEDPTPFLYQHLGQPCRAKQILSGKIVVDRRDARERFVIANNNEEHNLELIFIDFENDTAEVFTAPSGAGSWALLEVPGDRLIVGTFYNGVYLVFDLKTMQFVQTADFPGESYIWNLALGGDGRVYGGTYPGAKLGALDLESYTVQDLGAPVLPNMYLRKVMPAPGGKIVCYFMTEQPATRVYAPDSGRFEPMPGLAEGEIVAGGVCYEGQYFLGSTNLKTLRAWRGPQLQPMEDLPLPEPPGGGEWLGVNTLASDSERLLLHHASGHYLLASGGDPEFISNVQTRGRVYAASQDGQLLGIRGQDYFAVARGEEQVSLRKIPAEGKGRPSLFLTADDRGRIWGGPHFGQTLFYYDVESGEVVNTSTVSDNGGEVYECVVVDGVVYAAAYSGGELIRYDPDQPWDQWNGVNPRTLHTVAPDYIRPSGGIQVGPGGMLYAGWMAKYGAYGGALTRTDPKTHETETWNNPLGPQAIGGLATGRRYVYLGTTRTANGLPKSERSVRFGVWDPQTESLVAELTFDDLDGIYRMGEVPERRKVCLGLGRQLAVFDLDAMGIVEMLPLGGSGVTTRMLADGDRSVVFGAGQRLLRYDLVAREMKTLCVLPKTIHNLVRASDGRFYLNCGADLYRIEENTKYTE